MLDAVAGDFTVASSIGKSLKTNNVVPGGTDGLFIAGTNAATDITTALTANIIGDITGTLATVTTVTGGALTTDVTTAHSTTDALIGTPSDFGSGTSTLEDFHGGNTTIEAGTLKVKANSPGGTQGELRSSQIAVQAGATFDTSDFGTYSLGVEQKLSGAGTVDTGTGTLQVFSDNTVAPGDSVGTLTIDGDLTLNAFEGSSPTGGFEFELSPSTASGNDQVVVNGDITSNAGGGGNQTGIVLVPTGLSLGTGSYELFTFSGSHTGTAADYTLAGITTRYSLGIQSTATRSTWTSAVLTRAWSGAATPARTGTLTALATGTTPAGPTSTSTWTT